MGYGKGHQGNRDNRGGSYGGAGRDQGGDQSAQLDQRTRQDINTLILQDKADILVEIAKREGQTLVRNDLTRSQIRSIFGQARQIEAMWRIEAQRPRAERMLQLMKPRIAYQAEKENKNGLKRLKEIITTSVDAVVTDSESGSEVRTQRFTRFIEFFEAILAYHRAFGGKP